MMMTSAARTAAAWCALALLCAGCSTVTSLTPSKQPRSANGFYLLEADWKTESVTVIDSTLKAYVLIGGELTPMERTPVVLDRWQVYVPVPAGQKTLRYRFKFDFQNKTTTDSKPNSFMSPEHELVIVDR